MVIYKNWGHFVLRAPHPKSWGHVAPVPISVLTAYVHKSTHPKTVGFDGNHSKVGWYTHRAVKGPTGRTCEGLLDTVYVHRTYFTVTRYTQCTT